MAVSQLESTHTHKYLGYVRNPLHTAYNWNIMCQKGEGDCGLWFLDEITFEIYAESLKKIVGGNGLDWLCYLAGNFQTAPTIFFKLSAYISKVISLRTHKPESPSHFWHIIFQL